MKRTSIIILSVILLASCSRDANDMLPRMVFYAGFEQEDFTRTHLNENLLSRWDYDDRLSIFVGNTYNQQFRFEGATGDNNGAFSQVGSPSFISGNRLNANYAIYPYKSTNSVEEDGRLSVIFPVTQNYTRNSYGVGSNTAVAVTANTMDNFLMFKNTCGYLKVSLYGDAFVTSITLRGNKGEKIAGQGYIAASYSSIPLVTMGTSAVDSLVIDCGDGVELGRTSSNATDFYFVIPPVEFTEGITIKVSASDGSVFEKKTTTAIPVFRNVIQKMYPIEYKGVLKGNISFEDARFKEYCVSNFDTNKDGEISYDEAKVVKSIICEYKHVKSMRELIHFPALVELSCYDNDLTKLDLSKNTLLKILDCRLNELTSLDISKNTGLEELYCSSNNLDDLDLSHNPVLTKLSCGYNELATLNVSHNLSLRTLDCAHNDITTIDVSMLKSLAYLCVDYDEKIANLDLTKNTSLTDLECRFTSLKSLDLSNNIKLKTLYCGVNNLEDLNVTGCTALRILHCAMTLIASLDLSTNTSLEQLWCNGCNLSTLDVSNNLNITYLSCVGNPYLKEIWLRTGQTISVFNYDSKVSSIKYK